MTKRRTWIVLVIVCAVVYLCASQYYAAVRIRALQSLRPNQVKTLRLHVWGSPPTEARILQGKTLSEFLVLLSSAKGFSPNHPRGGWTCEVNIDTVTDSHFYLRVHATTNTGVFVSVYEDGWRQ